MNPLIEAHCTGHDCRRWCMDNSARVITPINFFYSRGTDPGSREKSGLVCVGPTLFVSAFNDHTLVDVPELTENSSSMMLDLRVFDLLYGRVLDTIRDNHKVILSLYEGYVRSKLLFLSRKCVCQPWLVVTPTSLITQKKDCACLNGMQRIKMQLQSGMFLLGPSKFS